MALTESSGRNLEGEIGELLLKPVPVTYKGTWCHRGWRGAVPPQRTLGRIFTSRRLMGNLGQWSKHRIKSSQGKSCTPAGSSLVLHKEIFPGKPSSTWWWGWYRKGSQAEEMNLHSLNYMLKIIENEKPKPSSVPLRRNLERLHESHNLWPQRWFQLLSKIPWVLSPNNSVKIVELFFYWLSLRRHRENKEFQICLFSTLLFFWCTSSLR